ncbi:hypothetical protein Taro_024900 [Colocasia esculenta]|uniref:Uncharacterized protein n=1 Tax=Colocasia esculenta TaxID=4460 RepID=A0A843V7H5_COLES|nr:hypothetical protein [Colocasia esculenta]
MWSGELSSLDSGDRLRIVYRRRPNRETSTTLLRVILQAAEEGGHEAVRSQGALKHSTGAPRRLVLRHLLLEIG